jgi:hypothetical protein
MGDVDYSNLPSIVWILDSAGLSEVIVVDMGDESEKVFA